MHLDDDFEGNEHSSKGANFITSSIVGVSLFLLIVFAVVLFVNREQIFQHKTQTLTSETESEEDNLSELPKDSNTEGLISGSTLISDDLSIWEEFPGEEKSETSSESKEDTSKEDPSMGGTQTLVTHADGREEWLAVSKYLPANELDNTGFVLGNGRMSYYKDGKKVSYAGIDISKYQGFVDFNEVKKDGIDFVMIRLGSRGYATGQISLDDCFADNIKRATDAGLAVGVTFFSQAVTTQEAEEEAAYVLSYLTDYPITYPVAFDMEHVENDTARIDSLSKEDKTQIAKAFLTKIEAEGYNGMIYGNKEWILTSINYAALSNYDIWLSQKEDLPDYPYKFCMWQYADSSNVDGIAGTVPLNICFIDYSVK